jgi:hypothetical protein
MPAKRDAHDLLTVTSAVAGESLAGQANGDQIR